MGFIEDQLRGNDASLSVACCLRRRPAAPRCCANARIVMPMGGAMVAVLTAFCAKASGLISTATHSAIVGTQRRRSVLAKLVKFASNETLPEHPPARPSRTRSRCHPVTGNRYTPDPTICCRTLGNPLQPSKAKARRALHSALLSSPMPRFEPVDSPCLYETE